MVSLCALLFVNHIEFFYLKYMIFSFYSDKVKFVSWGPW